MELKKYFYYVKLILLLLLLFLIEISHSYPNKNLRKSKEERESPAAPRPPPQEEVDISSFKKVPRKITPGCRKPDPCDRQTLPNGDSVGSALPDSKRKILLEYSPKADSTASVVMFLNEMGYIYGKNYSGFAHAFRQETFVQQCGTVTPCMYLDKTWFRFKVTRNPYDRAPSSFIHCMRTNLIHSVWNKEQMEEVSFYDFLLYLKSHPTIIERAFGGHAGLQSTPYERELKKKSINLFHQIIHCEDPLPAIAAINRIKGTHYNLNFTSRHFVKRKAYVHSFVGKIPWKILKNKIPEDYGCFYDHEIKKLVRDIYRPDILLYNYTFPFQFPDNDSNNSSSLLSSSVIGNNTNNHYNNKTTTTNVHHQRHPKSHPKPEKPLSRPVESNKSPNEMVFTELMQITNPSDEGNDNTDTDQEE